MKTVKWPARVAVEIPEEVGVVLDETARREDRNRPGVVLRALRVYCGLGVDRIEGQRPRKEGRGQKGAGVLACRGD